MDMKPTRAYKGRNDVFIVCPEDVFVCQTIRLENKAVPRGVGNEILGLYELAEEDE